MKQKKQLKRMNTAATITPNLIEPLSAKEPNFNEFLESLKSHLRLTNAAITVIDASKKKAMRTWAIGYPTRLLDLMINSGLLVRDEAIRIGLRGPFPKALCMSESKSDLTYHRKLNSFTRTWVTAGQIVDAAVLAFKNEIGEHIVLTMNRHKDDGIFTQDEIAYVASLHEVLAPSFQTQKTEIKHYTYQEASLEFLTEHSPAAILNSHGLIETCNKAFKNFGAQREIYTVNCAKQLMAFKNNDFEERLSRELMRMINKTNVKPIKLFLATDGLPIVFKLERMYANSTKLMKMKLSVHDPNEIEQLSASELQQIFGLTKRESVLLANLQNGLSVGDAAKMCHIQESTARSYIKSIVPKSGARNKEELLKQIAIMATITS